MEIGGFVNFELWVCGFMFTVGLCFDDEDKLYHVALTFLLWPVVLGEEIRRVLKL